MLVEMHNSAIQESQKRDVESHEGGSMENFRNDDWDYEKELEEISKEHYAPRKDWNEL